MGRKMELIDCPSCNGTAGTCAEEKCERCKGTGQLLAPEEQDEGPQPDYLDGGPF